MNTVTSAPAEIFYPESDGKPMAESDVHRDWMVCIISRLQRFYAGKRVYISGNLLVYYVEGNPRKSFAPDVFAVTVVVPRIDACVVSEIPLSPNRLFALVLEPQQDRSTGRST